MLRFTIITAVYNNASHIEDCIQSVIAQDYADIEHIVIDGGSNDGTVDIIKKHIHHLSKFISEKDSGIYDALNKGISLAAGDVIVFLHSDDLFASNDVLMKAAGVFDKKNPDSVFGDLLYVSKDNPNKIIRYWKAGEYKHNKLIFGWMPAHPAFFVKKKVYDECGMFDTKFRIAADYDLVLRFLHKAKISAEYLPEVFIKMRTGGASNKSAVNIFTKSKEDFATLRGNGFASAMLILFFKNVRKIPQFLRRRK